MQVIVVLALLAMAGAPQREQERPVPKDSARISIPGCARNRTFIVAQTPGHEPVRSDIPPGRRFRLSGKKSLLNDIKKQQSYMVEVTGLVRLSQLAGPGGVKIGGMRIGGGPPRASMGSGSPGAATPDPYTEEAVIDVESWRPLTEPCPARR